ncbi:MAG: hypothetical protein DYG98_00950 [Haliscomenobacteraceae bacterium CHB4]|nr:hypothetical protein [Saprospiraceae bacterium]MCE7921604.1 hypothetical protein [Haliscomenobacteraceae bacterium CHB4]
MKNTILAIIALFGIAASACAQTINWQAFQPEQKHLVYLQTGWDYSMNFGAGYGRKFKAILPVVANIEYSFPSGERMFDDFKVRIGGQVEVIRRGSFSFTAKAYSPIRRYENNLASLFSFGGEFSGVAGLYKQKWFVAGELGFDKAIATHIKHSPAALDNNPGLQTGWYVPTGGNWFYGVQTGYYFHANGISLKAGKMVSQGFKNAPFIPYYLQLAYQRRF